MHADLVGLIKAVNVSGTRDDTLICDALAREEAEQEELCDLLSGFYDVIRPEEEKVRIKVFFLSRIKAQMTLFQLLPDIQYNSLVSWLCDETSLVFYSRTLSS